MKKKLKYFLLVILIAAGTSHSYAQNTQERTELTRKEKRALEREQRYRLNKEMLENRSFVLESDYLQNRYGERIPVNSVINFVSVHGEEAVIQVGSNEGTGYNGVGGITAKGNITKWELKENEKKQTFDLSLRILTSIGIYDVNMSIGNFGASARLTGLHPGNLTFSGDLVAMEKSAVYEGSSL